MIILGDAIEEIQKFEDNTIDTCFTSPNPPLHKDLNDNSIVGGEANTGDYITHLLVIFDVLRPKLKESGSIFVQMGDYYDPKTRCLMLVPNQFSVMMAKDNWTVRGQMTWHRTEVIKDKDLDHNKFRRNIETIFWFVKNPKKTFFNTKGHDYWKTSVFSYPYRFDPKKFDSGLPHELIEMAIHTTVPKKNGIILDPLAGCYDKETEILTNNGFKNFNDLTNNDLVSNIDNNNNLTFVKPIKYYKYFYNGEMFKIKHKCLDLFVTPNHNLVYREHHKKILEIDQIKNIKYRWINIPCAINEYVSNHKEYFELPILTNLHKNTSNILQIQQIKMNLFLEFLGYYISEGSTNIKEYTIQLSQSKILVRNKIKNILDQLPYSYQEYDDRFKFNNKQLCEYLSKLGKQSERYIPREFLELSKNQLLILLKSLIDGDGCIRNNGSGMYYYTISKQLTNDVLELACKLGYSVTISERIRKPIYVKSFNRIIKSNKIQYTVNILTKKERKIDTYKKFKKEQYNDFVYCVEVPGHKLLIKRNNKICICGNTGTVGEVAKKLKRQFILIDISPKMVEGMRVKLYPKSYNSLLTYNQKI